MNCGLRKAGAGRKIKRGSLRSTSKNTSKKEGNPGRPQSKPFVLFRRRRAENHARKRGGARRAFTRDRHDTKVSLRGTHTAKRQKQ